jgi:hypothetical protein
LRIKSNRRAGIMSIGLRWLDLCLTCHVPDIVAGQNKIRSATISVVLTNTGTEWLTRMVDEQIVNDTLYGTNDSEFEDVVTISNMIWWSRFVSWRVDFEKLEARPVSLGTGPLVAIL